ncbi:MAG: hypothetical protein CVT64_01890 [Actinobacteria bacterium HGW-Actinobacteria-4]|nr:MAG: hypothetical protein CVT64_01890 [Actinobacteria bacterium HGW-Actinobacteria-4]
MSTWIWNRLPGNGWVKSVIVVVAIAALVAVLFEVVFPWAAPQLPFQDQTVE